MSRHVIDKPASRIKFGVTDAITVHPANDTIELFFRKATLPRGMPKILRSLQLLGAKEKTNSTRWNTTIAIARSSISHDALDVIEEIRDRTGASITRIDFALAVTGISADLADREIGQAIELKYQRRIGVDEQRNTTRYQNSKKTRRNLVAYADKPKEWVTGIADPVLWVELRLKSPDGIERSMTCARSTYASCSIARRDGSAPVPNFRQSSTGLRNKTGIVSKPSTTDSQWSLKAASGRTISSN
ncbi:MAG: hypothetical protein EOS25_13950 [Mesorhizobium sp.]|uniref:hypothetical protein n=1 Tax=Mesorhizobium sp. TaxID=1871066 RepID=UPI000FE8F059|nr:hypothetical protein [Mesorhizobium sp.]RWD51228.1 MAG: hypothetical protein EOS59_06475 [Mesorhizobium sp.]RWE60080.1 MAG: hypothetical protein EOS24_13310 [Mesorhizobium sp.]RWF11535.1 MAG: hypothetical protein EOS69_08830 [Mesorhizobium sp.]RWF18433.1 MAG: hypothetical protein EOS25_13950 [Mesorhizobium sp.]